MRHVRLAHIGSLFAAIALSSVATPQAAELAGVALPEAYQLGEQTLVLNGLGLREATWLKVDVYVAGLYLPAKQSDPEAILADPGPKRIELHFVRKVREDQMVEAWNEGFAKNAADLLERVRPGLDKLNGLMQDVKKGDTMAFTYVPDQGTRVEINGEVRGTIPGEEFARALFSVWLGPEPPNPGLKKGLLGGS